VLLGICVLPRAGWSQLSDWDPTAILGIPGAPLGRSGIGAPESFRYYLSLNGRYDTDVGGAVEEVDLSADSEARIGGDAGWGVIGVRQRARDMFSLDYHGSYRYYSRDPGRSGDSHQFSLNYVRLLTSRTQIYIAPSVGRYSYATAGYRNPLGYDPLDEFADPTAEAFDIRTDSFAAAGGLSHQLSRTLSFGLNGSGYVVRREDPRFLDSQGTSAGASLSKALGPTVSIGGAYRFSYFFFLNGYGETQVHSASFTYRQQLTEYWTFNLSIGASRIETDRLESVAVDPIVAAITGQKTLLQAANRITTRPTGGATLYRRFERASLSFHYRRGVDPGNGFRMTSLYDGGGVSYSYLATQKLNIGLNLSVSRRIDHLDDVGEYDSYGGGVGLVYQLWRFIHFSARVDARRWKVRDEFERTRVSASIGLTFSPGERPLSLF